jgi:iron complex outermembrane recepter protein
MQRKSILTLQTKDGATLGHLSDTITCRFHNRPSWTFRGIFMMKKQLVVAIAATFVTSGFAYAQTAQKVEKVEVTGSNIKRTDTETSAPLLIITRAQIEASTKPTVAELLRDIPQNGGQSLNETFTNSFAPGASGIGLRGLSQKNTLVLVNSRRMSNYGFSQNLFDTFVDLNSIPAAAVERIEVLKDGASAVYGSDAIAGVINIILRKDFKGGEVAISGGTSHEGGLNEYRASAVYGLGDLASDRYNFMGVIDYYKRDLLKLSDREITKTLDFRGQPGGNLARATIAAYYAVDGTPSALGRTPLASCPAENRIAASTINPVLSGTTCVYNAAPYLTLFPQTDRVGFLGRGTFAVSPAMTAFAELALSTSESKQTFTPGQVANGTGVLVYNPATGGVRSISNTLPATNPSNPIGKPVNILNSFFDVGGRDTKVNSDSGRLVAGVKGAFGNWDYEAALGGAQTKSKAYDYNLISAPVLAAAIQSGAYNFVSPSSGTVTAKDLRIDTVRDSDSKLQFIDAKTSTELMQLPAGPLGFAMGAEYRHESLNDRPDANLLAGNILGRGATATDGSRNSSALFVEFNVPVIKTVESQLAARYDRYSDFGSAVSPKAGVKWQPLKEVLLRGSYSEGFRAPTLPEASKTNAFSFTTVADPANGNRNFNIAQVSVSNDSLEPEKSKNYNFGIVLEPTRDLNVAVDYYRIRQNNLVLRDSNAYIIGQALANNPLFVDKVIRDPATGFIVYTVRKVRNINFLITSGFDIDLNYKFNIADVGKFTVASNINYVSRWDIALTPGSGVLTESAGSNNYSTTPRVRGNLSVGYERGPWNSTLTYRYIHKYTQTGSAVQNEVGRYEDMDLYLAYTGIKNLTISGSVRNLMDRKPPFDAFYANNFSIPYDFALYDARGRYYTVGLKYSFK